MSLTLWLMMEALRRYRLFFFLDLDVSFLLLMVFFFSSVLLLIGDRDVARFVL